TKDVATITRKDVHGVIDAIMARGSPAMANGQLARLRVMTKWLLSRELIAVDPTVGIAKPHEAPSRRERFYTDAAIAALWHVDDPLRDAIRLLLLTGGRRNEILHIRYEEVEGDALGGQLWHLPASRCKTKTERVLPFAEIACRIFAGRRVNGSVPTGL